MTYEEREAEAQRLMALLQGDGEALVIDEAGGVTVPLGPVFPTGDRRSCELCFVWLDNEESPGDGLAICDACQPEYDALMQRQVVCLMCEGKRLIFHEPGQDWHACEMCQGRGWIDGVVARWNGVL